MIITPVTVTDAVTAILSAQQALSSKAVVLENVGANAARIRWDGGAETLTFANGVTLAANEKLVLEHAKGSFHNVIQAICNTGLTTTMQVHVIV